MLINLSMFKKNLSRKYRLGGFLFLLILNIGAVSAIASTGIALSDELSEQRLMFSSSKDKTRYDIALGNFKRINSEWRVEKEISEEGFLERNTFEFRSGVSFSEAWRMLNTHFVQTNSEELYHCSGLDCGNSNVWANDYFGIKQLYGLDQSQRYKVIKSMNVDSVVYHILYLVKRGNRRIHAQVDALFVKNNTMTADYSADNIITALEQNFFWVFPSELSVERNGTWQETVTILQEVIDAIQHYSSKYPSSKVYIVGHDSNGKSIKNQIENSLKQAERVSSKLQPLVNEQAWTLHGVGGLSPRGNNSPRVELVVQPQ